LLDRIDSAERRHDFTRTEDTNLKFAASDCRHSLGDDLSTAVNGIETFRETRRATPAHLWHRLRNRRGSNLNCGNAAGGGKKFSTINCHDCSFTD